MATPEEMVASARAYAGELIGDVTDSLDRARRDAYFYGHDGRDTWTPIWEDVETFAGATLDEPPPLEKPELELPPEPDTEYTYQGISAIEIGLIPEFSTPAPVFDTLNRPNQLAEFNQSSPAIVTSFEFPTAPDALMSPNLTVPTTGDHAAPERPEYIVPDFDTPSPQYTAADPSDLSVIAGGAYRAAAPEFITMVNGHVDAQLLKINPQYHAQLARVEGQITTYLNGGTGLNSAVENAIYERARSKNNSEALRVRDQALADTAARGFTIPTGALLSATQQARQAGANNNPHPLVCARRQ